MFLVLQPTTASRRRPAAWRGLYAGRALAFWWAASLAGCGVEGAGTAATVGKLQLEQARQAREQQARVLETFQQAQQAEARRVADAASAAE